MVRRRVGEYERDSDSGLLLPRRSLVRAHPQYLGPPFFAGGGPIDPNFATVVLLTLLNGSEGATAYTDSSSYAHAVTGGTIRTNTSQFGGASLEGRVTLTNTAQFNFSGSAVWGIECWIYLNAATATFDVFRGNGANSNNCMTLKYDADRIVVAAPNAVTNSIVQADVFPHQVWTHFAVTSDGTNIRAFRGGVLKATGPTLTYTNNSGGIQIGTQISGNDRIDCIRVYNGYCPYTATFTPPAAEFPTG